MTFPHFIQTDADRAFYAALSDGHKDIVRGRYEFEREALENRIRADAKAKGETPEELAARLEKVAGACRLVVSHQLGLFWRRKR